MPKGVRKTYTYAQKVRVLRKYSITKADISVLTDCGYTTVNRMVDKYRTWHRDKYGYEPECIICDQFLKLFGIDVNKIIKLAKLEQMQTDIKKGTASLEN